MLASSVDERAVPFGLLPVLRRSSCGGPPGVGPARTRPSRRSRRGPGRPRRAPPASGPGRPHRWPLDPGSLESVPGSPPRQRAGPLVAGRTRMRHQPPRITSPSSDAARAIVSRNRSRSTRTALGGLLGAGLLLGTRDLGLSQSLLHARLIGVDPRGDLAGMARAVFELGAPGNPWPGRSSSASLPASIPDDRRHPSIRRATPCAESRPKIGR